MSQPIHVADAPHCGLEDGAITLAHLDTLSHGRLGDTQRGDCDVDCVEGSDTEVLAKKLAGRAKGLAAAAARSATEATDPPIGPQISHSGLNLARKRRPPSASSLTKSTPVSC